jgi:predicted Fe-Mo cluster-binding NifX family protein
MRIAVMADRPGLEAAVPEVYEESPAMLIIETDDESLVFVMEKPDDIGAYAAVMAWYDCEAVVCSRHIGQEAFEPLAAACVTRYDGAGLPVMEAARRALGSRLELVCDYEERPDAHSETVVRVTSGRGQRRTNLAECKQAD